MRTRKPQPFKPASAALAIAIASAMNLPDTAPAAETTAPSPTSTIVVTNCNDNGPGSLRAAVANAFDSDTIDLTHLTCSTISLSSGEIVVQRNALTIKGSGASALTVEAAGGASGRLFRAPYSNQSLALSGMTIKNGFSSTSGGCIASANDLTLADVTLNACSVRSDTATVLKGGAVYAKGTLTLRSSTITHSWVDPHAQQSIPLGCGAYAGALDMADSEITYNNGGGKYHSTCNGGGAFVRGQATISGSTIDNNEGNDGAGLWLEHYCGCTSTIANSTISNNVANAANIRGSAIYSKGALNISNSTIAFTNTGTNGNSHLGSAIFSLSGPTNLQSVIVAYTSQYRNEFGFRPLDLDGFGLTAVNSLFTYWPPRQDPDPLLLALAYNGGKTRTHALAAGSPAIDHGNNILNLPWDQRGVGFPRVAGSAADIGAFEVPGDRIFKNGFDP